MERKPVCTTGPSRFAGAEMPHGETRKPYKLKLGSSTDLFGMGSSKHWVLLANYNENSLLRNKVSYDLSGKMGLPYMQSVHVGMILNGKYLGNYLLCEQVKLEEDRVNVESFEAKIKAAAKAISKKTGVDKDSLEDAMMTNLEWVTSDSVTFEGNTYRVSDYYTHRHYGRLSGGARLL